MTEEIKNGQDFKSQKLNWVRGSFENTDNPHFIGFI